MPHVTFVYPCVGRYPETRYVRSWQMQPLSIGILAALTPPSWHKTFFDDRLESIDYDRKTDLAAISIETFTARRGYQIADEYRRRGVHVVIGGYHATFCPEEAQEHADAVCVGEAEGVWGSILGDAQERRLLPVYSSREFRPLTGVAPDRSIFSGKRYFKIALVETGRGCPFRCSFCSITAFYGGTYRRRPAEDVMREISLLGEKNVFLVDDNFVADVETAKPLLRALIPLRTRWIGQASVNVVRDAELLDLLAESGCVGLLIGFESLDDDALSLVGKSVNKSADYARAVSDLRRRGISVYGTFIFGLPGESSQRLERALRFAREHRLYLAAFNHLVPFPGTPIYKTMQDAKCLVYDRWWLSRAYRFGDTPFYPETMAPARLGQLCLRARRAFYGPGSVLGRALDFRANCRNPTKALYFFGLNLLMRKELVQKVGLPLGVRDPERASHRHVEGLFAQPCDDRALRDVCWQMPMPGRVSLAYVRDPSFLDALCVEGRRSEVMVGRDIDNGRIAALGTRSTKTAFVNGQAEKLGYLSGLRIREAYRGGTLLARGFRMLREAHLRDTARLYVTTILEGNRLATGSITSGRAGLPVYHDCGRFTSMAISFSQRLHRVRLPGFEVRAAGPEDLPAIVRFWQTEGRRKQFFPVYEAQDLSERGLLRGLKPSDILMADSGGELVGTVAAWDQRGFRQTVVAGYSGGLGTVRPVYNLAAHLLKYPVLPAVGSYLDYCYLAVTCVKDNGAGAFEALFAELVRRNHMRYSFVIAGFHERDPLLSVLSSYRHFPYPSRLYVACWDDGDAEFSALDGRVPYLEVGAL